MKSVGTHSCGYVNKSRVIRMNAIYQSAFKYFRVKVKDSVVSNFDNDDRSDNGTNFVCEKNLNTTQFGN